MFEKITPPPYRPDIKLNERNSNLELYRIIVMLLIVAHHYVVNSGLIQVMESEPLSLKNSFFYLYGMWGKTGIKCFGLITGYFMCKSHITVYKFLKLLLQVIFYDVVINLLFIIAGYQEMSFYSLYQMLWPVKSVADGFVSCFLLFYLFIPFLNVLIMNLDKHMHLSLIALLLFIYTFLGTTDLRVDMNYLTWFVVLYFISSYIRLYGIDISRFKIGWGIMSILSIVLSAGSVLVISYIGHNTPFREFVLVSDSNHILAVATSICLFMYFKDWKLKHSHFINVIAATTFGVLLIHANSDIMRQWLWRDTLDNVGVYHTPYAILHALVSVAAVFILCVFIDYIRIKWIEKPLFCWINNRFKVKT